MKELNGCAVQDSHVSGASGTAWKEGRMDFTGEAFMVHAMHVFVVTTACLHTDMLFCIAQCSSALQVRRWC